MIQGGSQRDRLSSHPLLDVGVTPASAGLDKGTLQPLLGCKDPITPERQLREVVPKGTHLRAMVPQVELGPKTMARGGLTLQEFVGLVDDIAEAVNGRGLAPLKLPFLSWTPGWSLPPLMLNPLRRPIPHPPHGLNTSGQRRHVKDFFSSVFS